MNTGQYNFLIFCNAGSYRDGGRNFRGGKKQHSMPNAHVRSEIKDMDQIRKERQRKANKISYMKSKSPKGKKSGRKGNNKRKSK
jgi:ATP-dependent RNA helicase DDX54/DBP10